MAYKFDSGNSLFFKELRNKVDQYFIENNLYPSGGWRLYLKGALQVATAAGLYLTLVFFTPSVPVAIGLCVLLGLNLAIIGFNIMHEGGHQSFSRVGWINKIAAYFLNVLGGSTYYWKQKHNIDHHTYTNIEGMDADIDVKPFMRLHEGQPLKFYHRFQHIYGMALYGFTYLSWIFFEDFKKYFTSKMSLIGGAKKLPLKEHFIFWATKLTYITLYVFLPIFMLGWAGVVGFIIVTVITGVTISIVFQLAHVVEATMFHEQDAPEKQEWAIHQLATTANFGTKSKFLFWTLGGLNFQVEHHLFPKISHIHYPKISLMVKEMCEEYNLAYNEYSTMLKAVGSHLIYLKRLGRA